MPTAQEKKNASPDYPSLAKKLLQTSGEEGGCKLIAGLYVVATPIGHLGDITLRALITLAMADRIACEDTRTSGGMLDKYGISRPTISYHDHNATTAGRKIVEHIAAGEAVALISDAGMPLMSDPGYDLVRACQAAGQPVTVLPGANAALTALAGSGLPTDQFHFAGFLPPKSAGRQKALAKLVNVPGVLLFYEAPQRVAASLADMAHVLGGARPAAVARELTKLFEETRRGTLQELSQAYVDQDVKGEIVILVGAAEATEVAVHDLEALLRQELKTTSLRDAVAKVSAITGAKKSEVYDLALRIGTGKAK